ncbi:hypothetical protein GCM10020358_24190 [Amorphoplanes nipponensis]|uniref:hypothetical protein n=1 Tax=Actinoplanes nipponensis TaxID=135950 RepID=UPI0031EFA06D
MQQSERPDLFKRLLSEVSWLATTAPTTSKPEAKKLGAKFTVTVLIKDKANQTYELYPDAAGGPRAYRPEKQPTGKKTAGWFYGRLTMSESLRLSGVPLKEKPDVVSGGIGGGVGEDVEASELDPVEGVSDVLADMRRLLLLNGAVLLTILPGLAHRVPHPPPGLRAPGQAAGRTGTRRIGQGRGGRVAPSPHSPTRRRRQA